MEWFLALHVASQLGLISLAGGVLTGTYKIIDKLIDKSKSKDGNNSQNMGMDSGAVVSKTGPDK